MTINDYLACQKKDLTEYGYPGYIITNDAKIWSIKSSKFLIASKTDNVSTGTLNGIRTYLQVPLMFRRVWRNEIDEYPIGDRINLITLGFPDYSITRSGRVWSHMQYKWLSTHDDGNGYESVGLAVRSSSRKSTKVHRLVALSFIPNPDNKPEVNHLDGNKFNNHDWNLEWSTKQENCDHAFKTGLQPKSKCPTEIIHSICKLLSCGVVPIAIARKLYVHPHIVHNIKYRRCFKYISKTYVW